MFDWADYQEDHYAPPATPAEAVREFGYNAGMDNPDRAWLLHDFDVWVANPHYRGPPVPHPESDQDDVPEFAEGWNADTDPVYQPGEFKSWAPRGDASDDIPF